METTGYDIAPYRPELRSEVADLMQYLWGQDREANEAYFNWKYEENPCTESPLGVVALARGRLVGFRGYFGVRFQSPRSGEALVVLCPGDTCVHPEHRLRGLSMAMGSVAMEEYARTYRLFLNMTCTKDSLPGYLKMGYVPLAPKFHLTRGSLFGLLRYVPTHRTVLPLSEGRIRFGRFGSILVSDHPRPYEMACLVAEQDMRGGKIRPFQDPGFFAWRFANPRNKYVFYYFMKGDVAEGYLVLGVSPNNRRGYILDHGQAGPTGVEDILRHVIRARHFDLLSVLAFSVDDVLMGTLRGLGFSIRSPVRRIERTLYGELPLLVRPVKKTFGEGDFLIGGLDARKIENWFLKPICSDAA